MAESEDAVAFRHVTERLMKAHSRLDAALVQSSVQTAYEELRYAPAGPDGAQSQSPAAARRADGTPQLTSTRPPSVRRARLVPSIQIFVAARTVQCAPWTYPTGTCGSFWVWQSCKPLASCPSSTTGDRQHPAAHRRAAAEPHGGQILVLDRPRRLRAHGLRLCRQGCPATPLTNQGVLSNRTVPSPRSTAHRLSTLTGGRPLPERTGTGTGLAGMSERQWPTVSLRYG